MDENQPTPPLGRDEATHRVAEAGESAAAAAGLRCVLERSANSESRYLHVLRGGVWYGLRVSCHEAVYDCCQDYEQLTLTGEPTERGVADACVHAAERAVRGGDVVASPDDVSAAIDKIAAVLADGRVYRDADGTRWRWSSDDESWRVVGRYWGDAEPAPPTHRPNPAVSARIRCQVRHAQNVTARWTAEGGDAPGA